MKQDEFTFYKLYISLDIFSPLQDTALQITNLLQTKMPFFQGMYWFAQATTLPRCQLKPWPPFTTIKKTKEEEESCQNCCKQALHCVEAKAFF